MFWRIIRLITNKLDNCLILIIVGFILIWRNTWLLYINVNNVGFYSSFISVLPFSLFSASPNVRFFIAPSESLCFWTANLFRWMDTKEFRSSPLCPEKNNAGRLRCPQHFLSSKTFLNPSFLIDACRKKKAHKLRWGMKAQKKSRQKEKAIPERGFKKRSLNLAEA